MEIMCLFVKAGKHSILIDTGWGTRLQVNTGKLVHVLEAEGIKRREIGTVINSHGHPDHIGGNTDAGLKPAFPNARYIMCRREWEFWNSGPSLARVDEFIRVTMLEGVQKNLVPLKERFELADDE